MISLENELPRPHGGRQIVRGELLLSEYSWYVGATGNLFDLRDRESDGDPEVLDIEGGAGQRNSDGQVSTSIVGMTRVGAK